MIRSIWQQIVGLTDDGKQGGQINVRDAYCKLCGGVEAYFEVKAALIAYYQSTEEAHFERIYHVLHELCELQPPVNGAIPKFKPVMLPFLKNITELSEVALKAAHQTMLKAILSIVAEKSEQPKYEIDALAKFLKNLEQSYIPRVYTTNYDNFFAQAYRGFKEFLESPRDFNAVLKTLNSL